MKIVINADSIKKFKPCDDRWKNYLKYYEKKSFSPKQFMGLKNITHKDKLWVAFRMMDKEKLKLAASAIARSVLGIYEKKYPGDMRVRECLDATDLYNQGKLSLEKLRAKRSAAYTAADAGYTAPYTAAYAAYAAADAAYTAADAADAAAYTAADAADAAAYAAADASRGRSAQEKLQRTIVLKYWK